MFSRPCWAVQVTRTGLKLNEHFTPEYDVTGIIGLSGKASGNVVISFEQEAGPSRQPRRLLGEAVSTMNDDVIDTVGELTNMIAGHAKTGLEEMEMVIALPTVIVGHNHSIRFPSKVQSLSIPFTSDWGCFNIEVGLVEAPVASAC